MWFIILFFSLYKDQLLSLLFLAIKNVISLYIDKFSISYPFMLLYDFINFISGIEYSCGIPSLLIMMHLFFPQFVIS